MRGLFEAAIPGRSDETMLRPRQRVQPAPPPRSGHRLGQDDALLYRHWIADLSARVLTLSFVSPALLGFPYPLILTQTARIVPGFCAEIELEPH